MKTTAGIAALGTVCMAALLAVCGAGCGRTAADRSAIAEHPEHMSAATTAAASLPASAAVAAQTPPRLELPNTAVHELPASDSGRKYQIWVDVPESYAGSDRPYPVVFVTDAGYSFPLVRSIRNLLGQRGRNIEDFILVGLPPEQGLTSKQSRSRDYTPSNPLRTTDRDPADYSATVYGEAAAYRDYIERQVFPLIATRYRADMGRKVFAGHSLGGLFGSFVLLTKPEMFQSYILSSPSLWFDKHEILTYEAAYAASHADLPARVMMYQGMYETIRLLPRYNRNNDMIRDMQDLQRRLKARGYPMLSVGSEVIADEDHLTVYPVTISRGLLWALPGSGPYTGG